jgi:hypothetical protein
MADPATWAAIGTVGGAALGASISAVTQYVVGRLAERREVRTRLYVERRELYAKVLAEVDEIVNTVTLGKCALLVVESALAVRLVGSKAVVRLLDRLQARLLHIRDDRISRILPSVRSGGEIQEWSLALTEHAYGAAEQSDRAGVEIADLLNSWEEAKALRKLRDQLQETMRRDLGAE